jgi:hypothetical protein
MENINDWSCLGNLKIIGTAILIGGVSGSITPAGPNIIMGNNALANYTTGINNIAIGDNCLQNLTTGSNNTVFGYFTASNLNGNNNIIIGNNATASGDNNISVGVANVSGNNINIGNNTITGNNNIVIGKNNIVNVNNVIIIGDNFTPATSGFYLGNIKDYPLGNYLYYNPITCEISYGNPAVLTDTQLQARDNEFQLILGQGLTKLTLNSPDTAPARVYTIPDVGAVASFILTTGTQSLSGKTFINEIYTTGVNLGGIITANGTSGTMTIPDVGSSADFVMSNGNQTINGLKSFTNVQTTSVTSGLAVITASSQNGTSIFTIPDIISADFVMTAGNQTINGNKTFTGINISKINNQILMGASVISTASSGSYTIPDVGAVGNFLLNTGGTITGVKTFTNLITNNLTIGSGIITSSGTTTIPNVASGEFLMSTGAQDITDDKFFKNTVVTGSLSIKYNALYNAVITSAGAGTYTIPTLTSNSNFVLNTNVQNINGIKTFSSIATNTLYLSAGGFTAQILPSAANTYNIPTGNNFVMDNNVQTISGAKTFTSSIKITGADTYYGENAGDIATGTNNIGIGYQAAKASTGNNNIFIGYDVKPGVGGVNNAICIGCNTRASNSIVITTENTTNIPLNSGFYVKSVRNQNANLLTYDGSEITYTTNNIGNFQKGTLNIVTIAGNYTTTINYSPTYSSTPVLTYSLQTNITNNIPYSIIIINNTSYGSILSSLAPSNNNITGDVSLISKVSCGILSDGTASIIYSDSFNFKTVYINSTNIQASTWNTAYDIFANTTTYPSDIIKLSNNNIAFSGGNGNIIFYYTNSSKPTSAANWLSINPGFVGTRSCLILSPSNYPSLCYVSGLNELYFALAGNVNGTTWNTPVKIATDANTIRFPVLLYSGNNPIIIYLNTTNKLKLLYSPNTNGTGTWNPYDITTASGAFMSAVVLATGNIMTVNYYQDLSFNSYTRVSVSSSPTGAGTWIVYDFPLSPGGYECTIKLINNIPLIVSDNISIRYAKNTNPLSVSEWNTTETFTGRIGGSDGPNTNLLVLSNNNPAIFYTNGSAFNVGSPIKAYIGTTFAINYISN